MLSTQAQRFRAKGELHAYSSSLRYSGDVAKMLSLLSLCVHNNDSPTCCRWINRFVFSKWIATFLRLIVGHFC